MLFTLLASLLITITAPSFLGAFVNDCGIYVRVQTADCLMAGTSASMTFYYASLVSTDMARNFLNVSIGSLVRLDGGHKLTNTHTSGVFEQKFPCNETAMQTCFSTSSDETCAPGADAFFIKFDPAGSSFPGWSPISIRAVINYTVFGILYERTYEFVNVFRCDAWIVEKGIYQFGPRHGLIIRHEALPGQNDWVRPWI